MQFGNSGFTCLIIHRDLDEMEIKVKGKFVTSSKAKKKIENPSCYILEKLNKNHDKK